MFSVHFHRFVIVVVYSSACDPIFASPCKGKNNICDAANVCACVNSEYQPEAQGNDCYGKSETLLC